MCEAQLEDQLVGVLIAESLLPDADLPELGLTVTRIVRSSAGVRARGQPATWTLLYFQAPAAAASRLADVFAAALRPDGGWYVDWNAGAGKYVVFAGRIFRYQRGDQAGRTAAEAFARQVGVPEAQLDWAG